MTGTSSTGNRAAGDVSLFERLGGAEPLLAAIDDLYRAILADPVLAPYFEGCDISAIKRHQIDLFSELLGGPTVYSGNALSMAHQHLDIPVDHYLRIVGHLVAALVGLGIPDDVLTAIGQAANAIQPEIVHATEGGSSLSPASHSRS